jgi:CubicO group peptidase (beta-lactamase class C family)
MGLTFDRLVRLSPDELAAANRQRDRYFPIRSIDRGRSVRPLPLGPNIEPLLGREALGLDQFMALNRVAGVLVLKDGRIRLERYALGLDESARWASFSVGKSVTGILAGMALRDRRLRSLEDSIAQYVPEMAGSAYGDCAVGHLLGMSSGIGWKEAYRDGQSDIARMYQAVFARRKGGVLEVLRTLPRDAPPGRRFLYSTGETHLLGEVVSRAVGKPLAEYLSQRLWSRFGMEADGFWTLDAAEGQELAGGGLNFVLRDYGRLGQFILEGCEIDGEPVVPADWFQSAARIAANEPHLGPGRLYDGYPFGYSRQWWVYPPDGGRLPEHAGAFTGMGIFGQFLYLNPKERVVCVILSAWPDTWVAENERRVHEFLAAVIRTTRGRWASLGAAVV